MFNRESSRWKLGLPKDAFFKFGLIAAVLQGLSAVALLGVSAWLISRAAEMPSIVYLSLAVVGVRGFAIGRATFRYAERLLLHESAFRLLGKQRPLIFRALIPFIPAGMAEQGRGETLSRITNDVDELQNLPLRVVAPLVQSLVVGLASAIFMMALLPSLAIAILFGLIAAFLIAMPVSAKLAWRSDKSINPIKGKLATQSLELLENQAVLLAYGWMPAKLVALHETDLSLAKASTKSSVSNGVGQALFSALSTLVVLAGCWFGGNSVSTGGSAGVELAVFTLLPMAIFEVVQAAQPTLSAWRKYEVSAGRVLKHLDRRVPKELDLRDGNLHLADIESLELLSVGVEYPDSAGEVVSSLDLQIHRGEKLLLSGPSGSGKSSIALVLSRLLNNASGRYLVNGEPVENYSIDSVRKQIGYIEQNPTIFLGDLRSNLSFAKTDATDEELIEVLERVGLWQTFSAREGLETQLGDRGVLISGGEAQRLALARAILADFQVLILDEPTANVDEKLAEVLVRDLLSISASKRGRSILLISHESNFAKFCDRVIQL